MASQNNFQDKFLKQLTNKKHKVVIYLVNGVRLTGEITGFDNFVIIVDTKKGQQMVYKHAVSTILPENELDDLTN